MSALLSVHDLTIVRDGHLLLKVPSLNIEEGQTLAIVGPNGAGKSTLMLALATLLKPTSGTIMHRDQLLAEHNSLSYRRRLGLVLQEPLLLSGSVRHNVEQGLRYSGIKKATRAQSVTNWLTRLNILSLQHRSTRKLSGGEAHRVSLARAFVLQPEILMLDEPFSALDTPTRRELLLDLQRLLHEARTTTLFVTHDLDEALLLADQVAVLIAGELRQTGTPREVFSAPVDADVAAFVGVETIIPGKVTGVSRGLVQVRADGCQLEACGDARKGQDVYLCLRPEDITLFLKERTVQTSARNQLTGTITRLVPQGALTRVYLDCGFPLVSLITRASSQEMRLKTGTKVFVSFKATAAHLIAR